MFSTFTVLHSLIQMPASCIGKDLYGYPGRLDCLNVLRLQFLDHKAPHHLMLEEAETKRNVEIVQVMAAAGYNFAFF